MERFRFYVQCENLIGQTDKTIFDAYVIVLAETVDQTGRHILAEVNSGSALDAVNNGFRRFSPASVTLSATAIIFSSPKEISFGFPKPS